MTVKGLSTVILETFTSQDIISSEEIALLIKDKVDDKDLAVNFANLAMKDLESLGVVRNIKENYWVLVKPITDFNQSVNIDGILAVAVAKVLNQAAKFLTKNDDVEICNPLSITDKDIETLALLADSVNNKSQPESLSDDLNWLKNI